MRSAQGAHIAEALADIQAYVADLERERGFAEQTATEKCLLLGEELGELFKAVRKRSNLAVEVGAEISSVDEELADILIYLCSIANRFGLDPGSRVPR